MTTPMTDRELMQQALEALEANQPVNYCMNNNGEKFPMMQEDPFRFDRNTKAIAALRERLAQPVQEPVDSPKKAGAYMDARLWEFIDMAAAWPEAKPDSRIWGHVLVYAPKQPQMQPCAGRNCGSTNPNLHSAECFEDYEQATGMNQWVGLTADEIWKCNKAKSGSAVEFHICVEHQNVLDFAESIEAKLKEKNHG